MRTKFEEKIGLKEQPSEGDALFQQGLDASRKGKNAEALACLNEAAILLPTRADVAYNNGVVLHQNGFPLEAIAEWSRAAQLDPTHPEIWVNLTLALGLSGQAEKAFETYKTALKHHPACRDLLYNCANLLFRAGQIEESLAAYHRLLKYHPDDVPGLINAGKAAKNLGLWQEAEAFLSLAIAKAKKPLNAIAHFNRANVRLMQGKWQEGFEDYEWRLQIPGQPPAPWGLPAFRSDLPRGAKILLWSDQGIGDAIMFLRFAPALAEKGYQLFFFAPAPLKPLLSTLPYAQGVFSPFDPPQPMDSCLALGSLAHVLKIDPFVSRQNFYLPSSAIRQNTNKKRVGIVWAGNPKHPNDAHRSLSLERLAPLFSLSSIKWASLQLGERAKELRASPFQGQVEDLSGALTDFAATAHALAELDLLISVDTATAHLAGAMGKPVWTLLPAFDGDWRWGKEGCETFWYPSMRLFRQPCAGAWDQTVEDVKKVLERQIDYK